MWTWKLNWSLDYIFLKIKWFKSFQKSNYFLEKNVITKITEDVYFPSTLFFKLWLFIYYLMSMYNRLSANVICDTVCLWYFAYGEYYSWVIFRILFIFIRYKKERKKRRRVSLKLFSTGNYLNNLEWLLSRKKFKT